MLNRCLQARAKTRTVLVAVGVAVAGGCADQANAPVAAGELLELDASNVMYGMVSNLTLNGVREGRIEADTAYLYADSAKALLRAMRVVFFDDRGGERATVTGLRGEWHQDTDRMVARGDVVLVVNADGRKIESAEIHYDPQSERIWSDSATVQTLADGTVTSGTAFQSDLDFNNVRIQNPRGGGVIVFP